MSWAGCGRLYAWNYTERNHSDYGEDRVKQMFVKGDTAGRAEAGRKGAQRSAEVRRRKRALREAAQALLWHGLTANEQVAAEQLRAMGVDDPTGADAVMLAQFVRACAGDTDAARFVRDTAGERPGTEVNIRALAEQPAADLDLAALSDAELAELAEAKQAAALPERCTDVAPAAETMPAKP